MLDTPASSLSLFHHLSLIPSVAIYLLLYLNISPPFFLSHFLSLHYNLYIFPFIFSCQSTKKSTLSVTGNLFASSAQSPSKRFSSCRTIFGFIQVNKELQSFRESEPFFSTGSQNYPDRFLSLADLCKNILYSGERPFICHTCGKAFNQGLNQQN